MPKFIQSLLSRKFKFPEKEEGGYYCLKTKKGPDSYGRTGMGSALTCQHFKF
jgi:hypothetical protein